MSKSFGAKDVLDHLDLEVAAGEFLTLLGPSGCGKSTLLRLIAGLEEPSTGRIAIGERRVDDLPAKARSLAMVFQSYALYPHMSVFDNIAMPLVMRRMSFAQRFPVLGRAVPGSGSLRADIRRAVERTADILEIGHLLPRLPGALSGGQRQRVALGRALVAEPSVFLMDEPLSNLDVQLRMQMRTELAELHRRLGITFIYVTHDQTEAMTMSGQVAVMMDGALLQIGRPAEVYHQPKDLRVARFVGQYPINILPGDIDAEGRLSGPGITPFGRFSTRGPVTVGLRPEDVEVVNADAGTHAARVLHAEDHGGDVLYNLQLEDAPDIQLRARVDAKERRAQGAPAERLHLRFPAVALHIFGPDGQRLNVHSKQAPQLRSVGGTV
ncbi:ABC transporter ATP-binding protein [Pontivivens ytuae]|uniref:ABC transporter ATP-binding protein n=1 Tax=Pontivivens ytuae TaxID=2789856 RepID=UPI001E4B9129|nr:ABC transporter ATP-binding protein [Pontivivens ytuae]